MTPQLQQAIKLLQLSNVELAEYCEQELERNPLLERDETRRPEPERERGRSPRRSPRPLDAELARDDFSKVADIDCASHDNMYDARPAASRRPAENAPLTDWTHGQVRAIVSTATRTFSNPRSPTAARSRIICSISSRIAALSPDKRLICLR